MTYALDASAIAKCTIANYGFEVFKVKGEHKGSIAPGEHVHFVWTFHPIEAKAYNLEVILFYLNLKLIQKFNEISI